jgi:hypothetical protein
VLLLADPARAQTILRVDAGSTDPAPDGSTWPKAFPHLQDALAAARPIASAAKPVQIWVAAGTYMPDGGLIPPGGAHIPGSGERIATFTLLNNTEIYGGFPTGGGDAILSVPAASASERVRRPCERIPGRPVATENGLTPLRIHITMALNWRANLHSGSRRRLPMRGRSSSSGRRVTVGRWAGACPAAATVPTLERHYRNGGKRTI